tara:strand:- start:6 stop:2258 length:2253 start_codon:yes stop_codon:yes gene_type:complete
MQRVVPIQKDIVLIGGGHSHVAVLRAFGMDPIPGVRLTLISPQFQTPYSGMLPGYLAGHYSHAESHIPLLPLCQFAGAQFFQDRVVGLDLKTQQIQCEGRPPVQYDALSIDIGSTPMIDSIPGAREHAIPVKPVDAFLKRWETQEQTWSTPSPRPRQIVIVGGGAGGVELTLSLKHRLKKRFSSEVTDSFEFTLLTASHTILPTHNRSVRNRCERILRERSVKTHLDFRVERVEANRVQGQNGQSAPHDLLLWATHASAPKWPRSAGLKVDSEGFILVNEFLQSPSHPNVFASGDIASMQDSPRPKSGVFAVRQGPPLTRNLRRIIHEEPLERYHPQKQFLSLISTGDPHAIASRGPWAVEGSWVWRWKDRIDRRFVHRFQQLPEIEAMSKRSPSSPLEAPPEEFPQIRCTGCGSKVGATVLTRVLTRLRLTQPDSVSIGLESPDDAAVLNLPSDTPLIQTVDSLPAFLDDPWLFARIATVHALNDVIAMGAQPHSAQIIATLPYALERPLEETLFQLLSGALVELESHGASLIGGHTLEGERLAIGLAINGTASPRGCLTKSGLRPGDRLVMTKPLGTGVLLAAHMRRRASSHWIEQAIGQMLRSNATALPILQRCGVQGVTDITGFGLVGHLLEMLDAAHLDATVAMRNIPLLEGASQCSQSGIGSSVLPQNRRRESDLLNRTHFHSLPEYPLLFDPQTSGGLLFGIEPKHLEICLDALREAGWYHAVEIGTVQSNPSRERATIELRP